MKKLIASSILAIGLLALTQQEASAWINSRFGIGLNWDYSSGGNSVLWGAWRNGQPPAPDMGGGPGGPYGGGPYGGGPYGGAPYGQAPYAAPRGGYPQQNFGQAPGPMPGPQSQYVPSTMNAVPQGNYNDQPFANQPYAGTQVNYNNSPYHFANYPRQSYYYPSAWYYGR